LKAVSSSSTFSDPPLKDMKIFKPGDEVQVKATVVRMRGTNAEMQLADGQLLRTPAENVELQQMQQPTEEKAVTRAPEDKAIRHSPENKQTQAGRKNERPAIK